MNTCLLLIDLQNDYFPGGKMELVEMPEAAANAQLLLHEFRRAQRPIVHVQHISARPGAGFFLPDSEGAKIHNLVAPRQRETVVVKNYPNSFRATGLLEILQQQEITNLLICGAMSHMCIDATTRAAFDFGFDCTVAEDACATRDLQFNNRTVQAAEVHATFMAALGAVYAQILRTRVILENRF
jgi:nicotinamidase-related amidase